MKYMQNLKNPKPPSFAISDYHRRKAERLKVSINYSNNPDKKLDVFNNGKKIASIGAAGYWDFISYLKAEKEGKFPEGYAEKRRRLYKLRHQKNNIPGTPGHYALEILW